MKRHILNIIKAIKAYMNKKYNILAIPLCAAMLSVASCNSKEESSLNVSPVDYSSTAVTAFALQADKSILNNLDSVFFTIDLNGAKIYNADSLPYGTKIDQLKVSLSADASAITAYSPKEGSTEVEEIDLLTNSGSQINFSMGEVRVKIVSYDGVNSRDYYINVNVHKVEPDSLYWSELACKELPSALATPSVQKSVKFNDKAYCLTSGGGSYSMAVSDDPFDYSWTSENVVFPQAVDVRSLTATADALYILATDGSLLSSTDGTTWSATGEVWHSIAAPYNSTLIGIKASAGAYDFATYPAGESLGAVPSDFPLSGASSAIEFSNKWASADQIVMFGGRSASGEPLGTSWAFDGTQWAKLSETLPALDGVAVTECTICEIDTMSWRPIENTVLLAFGGIKADNSINRDVYLSRDLGIHWKKGDEYLQLPEYMPSFYNVDILQFEHLLTLKSRSFGGEWTVMPTNVPFYLGPWAPVRSRITMLPTSWHCPFLYMFGGNGEDGGLHDVVWRGVVNHFTFRPLE